MRSLEAVRRLYDGIGAPVVATDITTAEMIKYASNAFLATRISFMNEIAAICDQIGASIDGVSEGLALDSRSGARILAGVGYGGSCLPKDVGALEQMARQSGDGSELLRAVIDVNERQWLLPRRVLRNRFGDSLCGLKVAILGLTFKPGTGDLTEAPAVKLAHALERGGWGRRNCCDCWRWSSCATSGPAALTRNAALPSGHPRTPHLELSL